MNTKTRELSGSALNWAVATCLGCSDLRRDPAQFDGSLIISNADGKTFKLSDFSPSTGWSHGGKIIEREGIELRVHVTHNNVITSWAAEKDWPMNVTAGATGPTPLIAAMRCFVSSKLGDEVEVPEELL